MTKSSLFRVGLGGLILAGAAQAAIAPRQDDGLAAAVQSAVAAAGLGPATLKPKQKIEQVLAVGDSYTAGVGSNGLPDYLDGSVDCSRYKHSWPWQLKDLDGWNDFNDGLKPQLNFGACTGATSQQMIDKQLAQGTPDRDLEYIPVGKPQVAVLTIGGNDVGFSGAINDCIYRVWFPGDCDDTLTKMENYIASADFQAAIIKAFTNVIEAGRLGGGADPPESFQLYVAEYIPFWNHDDHGCDDISWCMWYSQKIKLTTDLRLRMNHMVDQLNNKIHSIVDAFADRGVIWVGGVSDSYNTHRFCEPAPTDYLKDPVGSGTWFWSWGSGGWQSGSEGPDDPPSAQDTVDLPTMLVDALIPDVAVKQTISEANPPWNVNPAFKSEGELHDALNANGNDDVRVQLDELTRRMFHPKGSGYTPYANAFLDAIRNNRDAVAQQAPPPPPPPPPAFAAGTCCFHLNEYQNCNDDSKNLFASVSLLDNSKKVIYTTADDLNGGLGMGINAPDGGNTFQGPLPKPVHLVGEHQNDYIQFSYGDVSWTSGTTDGPANCNAGGWDPKEGPQCLGFVTQPNKRQMDCCFPC